MYDRDRSGAARQTARPRRRVCLVGIGALVLATVLGVFWVAVAGRDRRSADERLAEIEAARAIPDSENAAILYNQLLQDPNGTSIIDDFPESPAGDILDRVRHELWLSADFPGVATWVKQYSFIIDKLLEASRHAKCRFPISIDIVIPASEMDRAAAVRKWGFLLTIAANNDLAEGRCGNAMEKWRCLLRMASHLGQHPAITDWLLGQAVALMALESMASFIVAKDATESHLQEIETFLWRNIDNPAEQLAAARLVEDLRAQKMKEPFGPGDRLALGVVAFLGNRALNPAVNDIANEGRCALQGMHILIALQRYRIATSRWPQNLDELRSSLSRDTLTDPISRSSFVYRPTGNEFVLYSKGRDNTDQGGRRDRDTGVDDWPIWPPRGRSERPARTSSRIP